MSSRDDGHDPMIPSGAHMVVGESSGSAPQRLSRSDLFMQIAHLFGRRSSCPRADVGCIAVLEGRIIASGYVGAPHGQPHCTEVGCAMKDDHCERTVHAEANLVAWSARVGTPLLGSTVWCTHSPCLNCTKLLANAGVEKIVYSSGYWAAPDFQYFKALGINLYTLAEERFLEANS